MPLKKLLCAAILLASSLPVTGCSGDQTSTEDQDLVHDSRTSDSAGDTGSDTGLDHVSPDSATDAVTVDKTENPTDVQVDVDAAIEVDSPDVTDLFTKPDEEDGGDGLFADADVADVGSDSTDDTKDIGCIPSCDNKECGPDGCGGKCGECNGLEKCSTNGKCYLVSGDDCFNAFSIDTFGVIKFYTAPTATDSGNCANPMMESIAAPWVDSVFKIVPELTDSYYILVKPLPVRWWLASDCDDETSCIEQSYEVQATLSSYNVVFLEGGKEYYLFVETGAEATAGAFGIQIAATNCMADCGTRECGPDINGCSTSCGYCGASGKCYPPTGLCAQYGPAETKWMKVPGGLFNMGCDWAAPSDWMCDDTEKPVHEVLVAPFYMMSTEVTQAQYFALTGESPSCNHNGANGDNMPVECTTWEDAQDFCALLGGSLPTEAQWEYAARAGVVNPFGSEAGTEALGMSAWTAANSGDAKHDVAKKVPNYYGLFDMIGNVWEYTNDCEHFDYDGAPSTALPAWAADCEGTGVMIRGGSFDTVEGNARTYERSVAAKGTPYHGVGFRCVKPVSP